MPTNKPDHQHAEGICGIYAIFCDPADTVYVGQAATNMAHRWRQHRHLLGQGRHKNPHLQNAWNKYGEDAFRFTIIEIHNECIPLLLAEREADWVQTMIQDGYRVFNIAPVGVSTKGLKRTEAQRAANRQRGRAYYDDPTHGAARRKHQREATLAAQSRTYRFLTPTGEIVTTTCMKDLCAERGLSYLQMSRMMSGVRPHYRGWRNADDPGTITWAKLKEQ